METSFIQKNLINRLKIYCVVVMEHSLFILKNLICQ